MKITRLLAQLATDLRRSNASPAINPNDGDDPYDETSNAISSLAASVNSQTPRSRVLNAVLSLMGLDTPQVLLLLRSLFLPFYQFLSFHFNRSDFLVVGVRIECLVSTIVSVLSSMASCCISRLGGGDLELIRVGSSISYRDFGELIRVGADVLENLEAHNENIKVRSTKTGANFSKEQFSSSDSREKKIVVVGYTEYPRLTIVKSYAAWHLGYGLKNLMVRVLRYAVELSSLRYQLKLLKGM